ncbi:hypothetical protein ABIE78_005170 [Sinorhizobium fredii]
MARLRHRMKTIRFDIQDFIKTGERRAGIWRPFLRTATLKRSRWL